MIASNIFRLIGDFFTWAFGPFNWMRNSLANADYGWWISNGVNWLFMIVLVFLFRYWMKESVRFKKEGIEDSAE